MCCDLLGITPFSPSGLRNGFRKLTSGVGLLAGLGVILWSSAQLCTSRWKSIAEVDSQGYIEIAKSLARGQWPLWPDEFSRFTDHVWVDPALPGDGEPSGGWAPPARPAQPGNEPRVTAKYAPGWPLCLAVGYVLGGAHAALWVNPVLGILGLLAFFLLARELFGNPAAAICTFVWAISPMFLPYAIVPLSHGAELTFVLLAFLFTARWARHPRQGWAFGAGFCAGFAVLIRSTEVLSWPALAVLYFALRREHKGGGTPRRTPATWRAWWTERRQALAQGPRPLRWLRGPAGRPWMAAALGLLLPLGFQLVYGQAVYGHPLRSGYYYTAEQQAFDFGWIHPALNDRIGSTWQGSPAGLWLARRCQLVWTNRNMLLEDRFLILCVLGLLLRALRPGLALAFALWCALPGALYLSYHYFIPNTTFLRFLLPGAAAAVLSIGFLFGRLLNRSALLQLLALAGFAFWIGKAPPRYLVRLQQVQRLERPASPNLPSWPSYRLDSLTSDLTRRSRPMPTRDIEPWLMTRATAVYAPALLQWQVALYPRVTAYNLDEWVAMHDALPLSERPLSERRPACELPWGHHNRARRIRAEISARGAEGLRPLFLAQVQRHLDSGTQVLIAVEKQHPVLDWARSNSAWQVECVYERHRPDADAPVRLPPLSLWAVRSALPPDS